MKTLCYSKDEDTTSKKCYSKDEDTTSKKCYSKDEDTKKSVIVKMKTLHD